MNRLGILVRDMICKKEYNGIVRNNIMIKNSFDEPNSCRNQSQAYIEENNLKRQKKKKKRQYPEAVELNKWPKFKFEEFKNEKRERGEKKEGWRERREKGRLERK